MDKAFPLLIAPGGMSLTAETAIELIETVIRIFRTGQSESNGDDPSATTPTPVRARRSSYQQHDNPTSVPQGSARRRYTIQVRDGATLQLKKPTPATTQIVDFLRKHPGSTSNQIVDATGLKKSTVSNLLVELNKQDVLRTDLVGPARGRPSL